MDVRIFCYQQRVKAISLSNKKKKLYMQMCKATVKVHLRNTFYQISILSIFIVCAKFNNFKCSHCFLSTTGKGNGKTKASLPAVETS